MKPVIYANFVQTVDGKTQVLKNTSHYWPIGSEEDRKLFLKLRGRSDTLIHGKKTAILGPTLKTLSTLNLAKNFLYIVVTNHPTDSLIKALKNPTVKTLIVTNENVALPKNSPSYIKILRLGKNEVNLKALVSYLGKMGQKKILLEGGAHTFGKFLKENLVDELYLTIAPKIFGNDKAGALTLVEGELFPQDKIKKLKLLSVKKIGDELFLRYKFIR